MPIYNFDYITFVEIELSSYCSLKCIQCPRNNNSFKQENLSLADFKQIFTEDIIKQIKTFLFCGTYGDCIHNKELFDIIKWIRSINNELYLEIQTHGNTYSEKWWQELASIVGENSMVSFAIDGLEDTYHIYRNGGSYEKVMRNAKTFIDAGGNAKWTYIVFKHNQHTVDDAKQLSIVKGFHSFVVKKTSRFYEDYQTNFKVNDLIPIQEQHAQFKDDIYTIKPPTIDKYIHPTYKIQSTKNNSKNIICKSIADHNTQGIYISVDGFVTPCGWLAGPPHYYNNDELMKLVNQGDPHRCNAIQSSIANIVNNGWLSEIESSWHKLPLNKCKFMCGTKIYASILTNREFYSLDNNCINKSR